MKNENLIHVKFEHEEARQAKRDVLSLEMNLLQNLRAIKKYAPLRLEELNTKLKIQKKLRRIILNIKKLQTTLPKLKIPEILKDPIIEDKTPNKPKMQEPKKEKYSDNLESQLKEIQDRLNQLQA